MRDYQDPLGQLQMMRKLNQQVFEAQRPNSAKNQPSNNASTVNTSGLHSARERPVLNYGERLYQKGVKRKEELERHIRESKTQKEEREKQRFTFQPQINQVSREIARSESQLLRFGE